MIKNFAKRSLCGLTVIAVLALASCSSENETLVENNNLPAAISADFNSRCSGNTIKYVSTGEEFYRHTGLSETDVCSVDDVGNEWFVAYLDNEWNRTIRSVSDITQLPLNVRKMLAEGYPEAVAAGFDEIKEVSQRYIAGTYYVFRYFQDTPLAKNCTHTLVVDGEGRTLKECTYMLNSMEFTRPFVTDISWISAHYEGATVLCYVNDMGGDDYIVLHDGILKSVYFGSDGWNVGEWKETRYGLPEGMSVPDDVLDRLHSLDAGFTYTEVEVVETPNGNYYSLVDGTKPERPGYNIGALSLFVDDLVLP